MAANESIEFLRNTVRDWFYDVACNNLFNSRDELIENIYLWMHGKNLKGTRICYNQCLSDIFSEKFLDLYYDDIVDELSACAEDVWYSLKEDNLIPKHYN